MYDMVAVTKIHFHNLKRLNDLSIEFPEKGVVALLGENGIGKTTVLHAIACLYKPNELQKSRGLYGSWWTDWFVPHTGNLWNNSRLRAYFSSAPSGVAYGKGEKWTPVREKRRPRYSRYIGFKDCMPHIEQEPMRSRFEFRVEELALSEAKRKQLLESASIILNRKYNSIQRASKKQGLTKFLYVTVSHGNPPIQTSYTSHYMGAGEQKVLKILEEVIAAPNQALIIIEEFEVAIHESALRKLIPWLAEEADKRQLQIVVSTHWPKITEFTNFVELRTLCMAANGQVFCINGYNPVIMHRLTGSQNELQVFDIWAEDSLAMHIIQEVLADLKLLKFANIKIFGSVDNSFSIAAMLQLNASLLKDCCIVLDGDRYRSDAEKMAQIKKSLSGTGDNVVTYQNSAMQWFAQLNPVTSDLASPINAMKPEQFLLEAAYRSHSSGMTNPIIADFFDFVHTNTFTDLDKSMIYNISLQFHLSVARVEQILISSAKLDESWNYFISDLRERFISMASEHNINIEGVV